MAIPIDHQSTSGYVLLDAWVSEISELTQPEKVVWLTGSEEEFQDLKKLLVEKGTLIPLNQKLRPNS